MTRSRASRTHSGFTVDLVGHSAGSIAICQLLPEAVRRGVKLRNVVFLAPACTVDLFYDNVVRLHDTSAHTTPAFEQFRLFTLRNTEECQDRIIPGLYHKSLLYLVSGVMEENADEPILGLARHTTGATPYDSDKAKAVHAYLGKENRVIRAGEPPVDGLSSKATSHGGFSSDPATLASLKAIVSRQGARP